MLDEIRRPPEKKFKKYFKMFEKKLTSDDKYLALGFVVLSDGDREILSFIFPTSSDIETEDFKICELFDVNFFLLLPDGFGG